MGRGDKKTKKGKIFKGSFGVVRPKKNISSTTLEAKEQKKEQKKEPKKSRKKTKK